MFDDMTNWTPCDTPPNDNRPVLLTTCRHGGKGPRRVHRNTRFSAAAWWSEMGARIQDVPVSWSNIGIPQPDEVTEPNEEARRAEVERSCAIMRGEIDIGDAAQ